jgi:hypothetical protein
MKKIIIILAIIFTSNAFSVGTDGSNKKSTQICFKVGTDGSNKKVGTDGSNKKVGTDGSNEESICQIIEMDSEGEMFFNFSSASINSISLN